jgi:low temperature requirement protein LtrA
VARFQRPNNGEEQRTSNLELFFDLVFVFAVTQVSHLLLDELNWRGAARAVLVLLVVWWAWNYTAWATNELDPESNPVKVLMLAIMLLALLLAVAIPEAFGSRAWLFATSYVAIQVGRMAFLTFLSAESVSIERDRSGRILTWFVASGMLWLAGAAAGGTGLALMWAAALLLEYAAPRFLYWVPWRPPIASSAWNVETAHFTERFQLFVLIALGESIVATGATTAQLELTTARVIAFGLAFLMTAAFWWLYFNYTVRIAARRLELAPNRTELARDAYTYTHVALVAGVIASAVGDELVIARPLDTLPTREVVAVAAGPVVYLLGLVLFRRVMTGSYGFRRLAGAAGCAASAVVGLFVAAIWLQLLLVAVLVAVIASEELAGVRRRARGDLSPLERLEAAAAAETGDG